MRVHKLERRVDDIAHGKVRVQPQQDSIVVSTPVTVVSASPGPPSPQESQSSSPSSATTAQVVTEHGITFSAELCVA